MHAVKMLCWISLEACEIRFYVSCFLIKSEIFCRSHGCSVAGQKDCEEACQEVQEAPEWPLGLCEGYFLSTLLLVIMHTIDCEETITYEDTIFNGNWKGLCCWCFTICGPLVL